MNKKTLFAQLNDMPHATSAPMPAPKGRETGVVIYKVMGKMFAIVSTRDEPFVILKSEPNQAMMLRDQYDGVGHRSHLDPRFWICVMPESDVPTKTIKHLVEHSYQQVVATLTRAQKGKLGISVSP